jgi:hypothetical protein
VPSWRSGSVFSPREVRVVLTLLRLVRVARCFGLGVNLSLLQATLTSKSSLPTSSPAASFRLPGELAE